MKSSFSILFVILIINISISSSAKPVIDVYYESLCPGCREFITESFQDFIKYDDYQDLATMKFHPYGNAKETFDDELKMWTFTCQHGKDECTGNAIESCARAYIKDDKDYHNYLICMESNIEKFHNNFATTTFYCVESIMTRNQILICSRDQDGRRLQHKEALETPEHDYVPWVTINGVHDTDAEEAMFNSGASMHDYLCSIAENKPESCMKKEEKDLESSNSKKIELCINPYISAGHFLE